MKNEHEDLLADLLDSVKIVDRSAGNNLRDIEINDGTNSVFVDVDCDSLPLKFRGTVITESGIYRLEFNLEHYYPHGKAEYAVDVIEFERT